MDEGSLRTSRLTEALVRRAWREVADTGPMPGFAHFSEDEYDEHLAAFLAGRADGPVHVFAYGSLIWKPVYEPAEARRASAPGWRRAFTLKLARFRGTQDRPGLMMQLDAGEGACEGMLHRLDPTRQHDDLRALWRREMTVRPPGNAPLWITALVGDAPVDAIAFVANHQSRNYVGGLTIEATADHIADACGHWGSCAEYLLQTIVALDSVGIRDPHLDELEALVAARLAAVAP